MADTLILPVGIGKPTQLTHNVAAIDCLLDAPSCPSEESTQCECGAFERADFVMGAPRYVSFLTTYVSDRHTCLLLESNARNVAVVDDDAPFVYPMRLDVLRFGRF